MTRPRLALAAALLIVMVAATIAATSAAACPNCAEAVASQTGGGSGQMRGYFWSIVSMVSMPFLLIGTAVGYFVLSSRKAARESGRS